MKVKIQAYLEKLKSKLANFKKSGGEETSLSQDPNPTPKQTWQEALRGLSKKIPPPQFNKQHWQAGLEKTKSFLQNSTKALKQKDWHALADKWKRFKFKGSEQWEKNLQNFLRPDKRNTIQFIFLIALTLLVPYQIGKIVGLAIKGRPIVVKKNATKIELPDLNPAPALQSIRTANIFRVKLDENDSFDKGNKLEELCLEGKNSSTLPIQLLSTSVLQDSIKSLASIQVRGNQEIFNYRVGEQIQNLARIEKIDRLKLHIKNLESGACEFVENKDRLLQSGHNFSVLDRRKGMELIDSLTPSGIKNDGNSFDIECSFFQNKLKDMGSVLTQAKGVPMPNPDGTISFKIEDVIPDGVFAHLGIQSDDVITKINGKTIQTLNEVMNLFGKINSIQKFDLTILRGNLEQTLNYQVSNCPNGASQPQSPTKVSP